MQSFSECIFSDVLSPFGNLERRADQVGNEYFQRVGGQAEEWADPADIADDAQEHSRAWYRTMLRWERPEFR